MITKSGGGGGGGATTSINKQSKHAGSFTSGSWLAKRVACFTPRFDTVDTDGTTVEF